jgi:hypothetical protein
VSWSGTSEKTGKPLARLRDDQNTEYPPLDAKEVGEVKGRVSSGSVPPGESLLDVLVFKPPSGKFRYLRLDLSGEAVGQDVDFRLRIPKDRIDDKSAD